MSHDRVVFAKTTSKAQHSEVKLKAPKDLGLKPDDRLGFGTKGRIIYATKRSNPGIAKRAWNDLFGRTRTRRRAAAAALDALRAGVGQLPKQSAWGVLPELGIVKAQLARSGSVRGEDYQALIDAIDRVERRFAERDEKLKFDTQVQIAIQSLEEIDDPSDEFDAWTRSKEQHEAVAGLVDFMRQTAAKKLILGGPRPDYSKAQPFADAWLMRPKQDAINPPRSVLLLDALARLVLRGCNSPTPAPRHLLELPTFSWDGDALLSSDGAKRFVPVDVQFASGGNGSVTAYRCGAEMVVAKMLHEHEGTPSRAEEALNEARVHWQANPGGKSEHIVGIRGTATTQDGRVMVILDYAPHGESTDLMRKLDSKKLETMDARMLMFADMVKAAAESHKRGVMHLDLKPANYFVGDGGKLLLGDFGTSRTELMEIGRGGIDSIDYTAPELESLGQQGGLTTYKADVWSLGVILYELNSPREANPEFGGTALRPFPYRFVHEGQELLQQFAKEKNRAARFAQLSLTEGDPLHELIMKMLDPDPSQRPPLEEVLKNPWIRQYAEPEDPIEERIVEEARGSIRAQVEASAKT